jgi:hypothetical protein
LAQEDVFGLDKPAATEALDARRKITEPRSRFGLTFHDRTRAELAWSRIYFALTFR